MERIGPVLFYASHKELFHIERFFFWRLRELKIIAFLQNDARVLEGAELFRSGDLSGEPVALFFVVDEIEFRPAVPRHANEPCGHLDSAAHRDKERGHIFAVSVTRFERRHRAAHRLFDHDLFVLDIVAHVGQNCRDFIPRAFVVFRRLFGERADRFRGRLDVRAAL